MQQQAQSSVSILGGFDSLCFRIFENGEFLPEVLETDLRGTAFAGLLPFLEPAQEWPR